ncbi:MAG: Ribonucleotide reductase of class II (coenzyme B12-dependent), partial [uncultured Solirubrobacteraceae bacterium]
RDLGAQVLLHALRARGDHHEPRDPVRQVDARLHHALARVALPGRRHPGGAGHPHSGGPRPPHRAGHRRHRVDRHRRSRQRQRRRDGRPTHGARSAARGVGDDRHPAGRPGQDGRPRPRSRVLAVRGHDAAHRRLLHVLELREQHRLRL